MPMAGLGSRFKNQGYKLLKPFIKVSKEPMFAQALKCLPLVDHYRFIYNNDYSSEFSSHLKNNFDKYDFSTHLLKNNTAGQAITCYEGSCNLDKALPITISACDNGMTYASKKFDELFRDNSCDIIVWGAKGYPGAINFPEMYGWIDYENSSKKINKVSVKKPLKNKKNDLIIVGTFTFKKLSYMLDSIKKMKKRKGLINNEYYIDNAINDAIEMGLNCKVLEIDEYICWGTPNDLKTFNYWQACFHKWKGHIYSKENDVNFNQT